MADSHHIEIRGLEVSSSIGVPDEERAVPQKLRVNIRIFVKTPFSEMADEIGRTLDYANLAAEIGVLAAARPRQLIETLASDIAGHVLAYPAAEAVEVSVEKFILPETDCVAVHLRREAPAI